MPVNIVRDDITRMKVDAIVNAANETLLGGGGVDGAIHRAAGPKLLKECRSLHGCKTGDAKLTKGYDLPARYVIHTVGPVWHGGSHGEEALLRSCYRRSLEIARDKRIKSIAFPLISSGVYGYPKAQAFKVAQDTIEAFIMENDLPEDVYIVVFDKDSFRIADSLHKDIQAYIDDNYVGPDGLSMSEYSADERRRFLMGNVSLPMSARKLKPKRLDLADDGLPMYSPMPNPDELLARIDQQKEESFSQRLLRLIDESGMTDAECYKRANVDRRHFSKIRSNKNYHPKKTTAIAFAVALELSLDETQDLLQSAGYTLTHSSRADVIIEYFIEKGNFSVFDINAALFDLNEATIGG